MSNPYGMPPAPSGPPTPPPPGNQPPSAPQPYGHPSYYGQGQPPAAPYEQGQPPTAPYGQQGYQVPSDATMAFPGTEPNPYALPATPQRRSSKMGLTAFILALLALVLGIISAAISGSAIGALMEMTNGQFDSNTATPAQMDAALRGSYAFLAGLIPTAIGIVAIVLGFIARKFTNYRVHSLLAIIIGFLAPIISFIVFAVSLASVYKP